MNAQELFSFWNTPYLLMFATGFIMSGLITGKLIFQELFFRNSVKAHRTPLTWTAICLIGICGNSIGLELQTLKHSMFVCTLPVLHTSFEVGILPFAVLGLIASSLALMAIYGYYIAKAWPQANSTKALQYSLDEEFHFYVTPFAIIYFLIRENIRAIKAEKRRKQERIPSSTGNSISSPLILEERVPTKQEVGHQKSKAVTA